MAGRIYDKTENARIEEFLSNQTSELEKIESEKELTDKKTLRYTIMLTGGVLFLVLLKFLISRKK
jgi:hypothetical protein